MLTDWKDFKGAAKKLDDVDLPLLGRKIGVGEDELHAFMDVEAAGSGFDHLGRPKMLFEPHIFYTHLSGVELKKAISLSLAYRKWGTQPYPPDSYPVLIEAMKINESAALMSASWGLGQILGENYKLCKFNTVTEMVLAFMSDEEFHLRAMIDFLIANHIDDDLKAHRWAVVARMYNGPGYAKNQYDTRLALAYAKWARIKDTPIPVEAVGDPKMAISASVLPPPPPPTGEPKEGNEMRNNAVSMPENILHEVLGGSPIGSVMNVVSAISKRTDIALVPTKPFSKSVEGWAAKVGGGIIAINALGPVVGLHVDGQLTGAIETATSALGAPPGYGTAAVYLVAGVSFVVVYVRKRWFTHTITPEAAERAAADGKVI